MAERSMTSGRGALVVAATIGYAPALVAARPEWASATTVLRMGVR